MRAGGIVTGTFESQVMPALDGDALVRECLLC